MSKISAHRLLAKSSNVFWVLMLTLVYGKSFAQSDAPNIHDICKASPANCLANIDKSLSSVSKKSRIWFQYKLYQLDALFQLVKHQELKQEIAQWVDVEDMPLKFKINIYILHAKQLKFEGDIESAEQYLNKSIEMLNSVSQLYTDPMMTIQIANTLNYLGKNQQGYDLLMALDKKYSSRYEPLLKLELYENLGHFSARLEHFDEHLALRHKALTAATELANEQRISVALYNVARAHQMLNTDEEALKYFVKARTHSLIAKDSYGAEIALMRQAQIAMKQKDVERVSALYAQIKRDVIYQYFPELLDELANYQ
ncbi:hypothetical protein AAD001_07430 [Colwelliaceae bacterium 6471]